MKTKDMAKELVETATSDNVVAAAIGKAVIELVCSGKDVSLQSIKDSFLVAEAEEANENTSLSTMLDLKTTEEALIRLSPPDV